MARRWIVVEVSLGRRRPVAVAVPDDDGAAVLAMSPAMLLPVLVVLAAVPVPVLSVLSIMAVLPVGIAAPMLAPVVVGERRRARQQERGAERQDDLVGHFFSDLSKDRKSTRLNSSN